MRIDKKLSILALMPLVLQTSANAKLVQEIVPDDEKRAIEESGDLIIEGLKHEKVKDRDVHIKQNGCLKASFKISDEIDAKFKFGVFAEPGKEFPTWLRYSNGGPKAQADYQKDGRGLGIKLMAVGGEKTLDDEVQTQDFLLANYPVFFVKTAKDYPDFFRAINSGSIFEIGKYFAFGRFWEGVNFANTPSIIKNVLEPIYYSQTAYRLSEADEVDKYLRVKYSVRPSLKSGQVLPAGNPKSPNLLREALVATLEGAEAQDITLEFGVQVGVNEKSTPTEDATVVWDEKKFPFHKVAEIQIPRQSFNTTARDEFCKNMSFNPGHSLHEHQPLGAMGRARLEIYRKVSEYRRSQTKYNHFEPTPEMNPDTHVLTSQSID